MVDQQKTISNIDWKANVHSESVARKESSIFSSYSFDYRRRAIRNKPSYFARSFVAASKKRDWTEDGVLTGNSMWWSGIPTRFSWKCIAWSGTDGYQLHESIVPGLTRCGKHDLEPNLYGKLTAHHFVLRLWQQERLAFLSSVGHWIALAKYVSIILAEVQTLLHSSDG